MPVTLTVDTDGVAHLVLDRPAKRNALDRAMIESLRDRVAEIRERDDVRVVVVRGAGGTFCAGADIADWVEPPHAVAVANAELGQDAFGALAALPVASLAVIEGGAFGGGLELALACDLRIATDDALLGLPELGLGNLPAWGGVARMVDIAGLGVARHVLLSGEFLSGTRAADLLLVTSAHPAAELQGAVDTTVARLLAAEPTAVRLAKQVLAGLESTVVSESALAGYTAALDSSRSRKQDFLDRKAAARAAKAPTTPTTEHPDPAGPVGAANLSGGTAS
jgi:enoyl-CoA hydratase/carnithine racemase